MVPTLDLSTPATRERVTKRVVVRHEPGVYQIIGTTDVQPPDMIEINGTPLCLVGLRHYRYYEYRPRLSPSDVMQTFHDRQQ